MQNKAMIIAQYVMGAILSPIGIYIVGTSFGKPGRAGIVFFGSFLLMLGAAALGPKKTELEELVFVQEIFYPVPKRWVSLLGIGLGIFTFVLYVLSV